MTLWPFPLQHLTSRAKPCLNGMHLSPRCQTLPLLNAANPPEQKKSYAAQNLEASGHNQDQKRNVFLWDAIMCICSTKSLSFLTQRRSSSVEMFFYCIEIICSAKPWGFWANPPSHLHLSKNKIQISSPDVKTQRLFHWSKNNLKRWWTPSAKPVYEKMFLFFHWNFGYAGYILTT